TRARCLIRWGRPPGPTQVTSVRLWLSVDAGRRWHFWGSSDFDGRRSGGVWPVETGADASLLAVVDARGRVVVAAPAGSNLSYVPNFEPANPDRVLSGAATLAEPARAAISARVAAP